MAYKVINAQPYKMLMQQLFKVHIEREYVCDYKKYK